MRKGISPLVAAVLLIAATMSIAGILAYWASNFVKSALPEVNSSQTTCEFADFQIYSCSYINTTQTISFVLYNFRTIPLTGLMATIFDVNNFPAWTNVTLVPTTGTSSTLPVGQYVGYQITGIPGNFTKLIVTTSMCPQLSHSSPGDVSCSRS